MPIKSILCVYAGESFEAIALETACHLAKRSHAELHILHIIAPIMPYPDLYGAEAATLEKEGIERARQAENKARDIVLAAHLPFSREAGKDPEKVSPQALFLTATGDPDDVIPAAGMACDLIVIGRDDPDISEDFEAILAALLGTSTPVLLVPRKAVAAVKLAKPDPVIALAWDGSIQASRAMRNVALMSRPGEDVHIVNVRRRKVRYPVSPVEDAARWLTSHGFAAHVSNSGPFMMGDGEAILMSAGQLKADLLIMGAYGRGHWREMLIGGVTDHVLKTADIPLLLCH